ncbi:MAG TPA: IS4 family transposase [Steroidobacteraceae bacterium]
MPTHPASVHADSHSPSQWVENEFKTLDLGDPRRDRRLKKIAADLHAQPGASLPRACGDWAGAKAAYRLFDNEALDPAAVLAAHRQAALERARGQAVVLAVQDTTSLNLSTHRHTRGLGPISNNADKTIGLLLHTTLLLGEDGQALGVLDALVLARDPAQFKAGAKGARNRQPAERKESRKWLQSATASAQAAAVLGGALIISIGDREGDSYELFLAHRQRRAQGGGPHELLIRCQHDRQLTHDHDGLFSHLQGQPVAARWSVKVPRRPGQKARTATLAIRFVQVRFGPPAHQVKYHGQREAITLWAISAQEENPPPGGKGICWRLLSTQPVVDAAGAITAVRRYSRRWQIELFHKILKSGCRIEERQFGSAERIGRCLALEVIVAARILAMTKAGREGGGATLASDWLAEHEWKALWCHTHRRATPPEQPPGTREAVRWIARLGGFLGRKHDGEPGMIVLWRGLQRLHDIALAWQIFTEASKVVGNA